MTTLTREEIYEKIWATPTHKLAKEFGITGTSLAKICKRMDIPVPPRGYPCRRRRARPTSAGIKAGAPLMRSPTIPARVLRLGACVSALLYRHMKTMPRAQRD